MKHIGKQTVQLSTPVTIDCTYSIVGPKESEGPLAKYFDNTIQDAFYGESTWEKAESKLNSTSINGCICKSTKSVSDINYILAGDLLNQCIASTFAIRDTQIPFLGLFGACSTMIEAMSIGSMLIDGEFANNVICSTSSHFCSAEKQFRFPLELGSQRPPSAQWTVTGAASALLSNEGNGPKITHVTTGKIVDMGVTDANNMGAAMAPAAANTIKTHFEDTARKPDYYDLILTGDLGYIGHEIVIDILKADNYNLAKNYNDCGILMFDKEKQDTHSGGSGCACIGTVFASYIFNQLQYKKLNKILLIGTGALMNATSCQQSESIPGIAHAIAIENI